MRRTLKRCALFVCASLACVACDGRPHDDKTPRVGPSVWVLDVSGGIPEQESSSLLSLSTKHKSFDALVHTFTEFKKNKDARALVVRFGDGEIGMARAEELGALLDGVRTSGKPVYCHADYFSNAILLAAARGCSKSYVSPQGEVQAVGIAAQVVYLHKLLAEDLHISLDILQVGKFKGAEEPLTRDGPSDEARASLESVLTDIREAWREDIRTGKANKGGAEVADIAEDGPYSPSAAKDQHLVDEVGYADDAIADAKNATGAVREEVRFGVSTADDRSDEVSDVLRALVGVNPSAGPIALVRASGSISMAGGNGITGGRGGIVEKELSKVLSRVEKDDDIKALVFRIDSPGGSALASDLLWHQLMKIRAKKPIVVSVGEMAASGGYYLASTGSVIYADKTSIVGSIGVVGGKVALGDALERVGVHAETFVGKRNDPHAPYRAGYNSLLIGWDDSTRARVYDTMKGVYDLFLQRVAAGRSTEGRTITPQDIAPSAEGRIFGGRAAKERKLIDEIGGLTQAIARARSMAKLPDDAAVSVIGGKPGLLDALEGNSAAGGGDEGHLGVLLAGLDPYSMPFVTSLMPLAEDEHTVLALPFVIRLE